MKPALRRSLGLRLSIRVVSIALLISAVLIVGLSFLLYTAELRRISDEAQALETATVPGLVEGLWNFNEGDVVRHLESVASRRHVSSVELVSDEMDRLYGDPDAGNLIHRYPLLHPIGGLLGELAVVYDRVSAYRAVQDQMLPVLAFVLVTMTVMALSTLVVFRRMIARPIEHLAEQARTLTVDTLDRDFRMVNRPGDHQDELGALLVSVEQMRTNLRREISERKSAELRLDETEQRYREVFDATGDAIFVHDALTARIVEVNRTMLEMYGYTAREIPRLNISDLTAIDEEFTSARARRYLSLAATGQPQLFEWRARRKDGTAFWVEVSLKRMEPTSLNRVLAVVRNIEARKAIEERQLQTQKMETLGQLAGGVAHDVNNVLGAILATAEHVPRLNDREELLAIVDTIRTTCKRGADLTGKLLSFSRDQQLSLEPVEVGQVLRDAAEILSHSIDKRIEMMLDLPEGECWVTGDAGHLENAILNLGLNARDAMPDGGRLTLGCAMRTGMDDDERVTIRVEDTGIGMDRTTRERAFEPFYTNKSVGKGTGLGLSSVYGTIEEHGGIVKIDSEIGKGTVIWIDLPATDPPTEDEQIARDVTAVHPAVILIIDDEEILRTMTAQILLHAGHQVMVAQDGVEGVEMYERDGDTIDLVIVDMIMPRMSGDAVFQAIREMNPEARVLLSTGFAQGEVVDILRSAGITGIIAKPYSKNDLLAAVNQAMAEKPAEPSVELPHEEST